MKKLELNHFMLSKYNNDTNLNPAIRAIDSKEFDYVVTEGTEYVGIHSLKYVGITVMISSYFIPINRNRRKDVGMISDDYEFKHRNFIHKADFIQYYRDYVHKRFCFCDREMLSAILSQYDGMQHDWIVHQIDE